MNIIKVETIELFQKYKDTIELFIQDTLALNFTKNNIPTNVAQNKYFEILSYIENKTAIIFFALENEKLIGWVWAYEIHRLLEKRLHITEITVSPNNRGLGIGKKLLQTIFDYALKNSFPAIDLMVTANNDNVVHFYKSSGFFKERYLMCKKIDSSKQ